MTRLCQDGYAGANAARIALPARRHGESFAFAHEGHGFRITVGCDPLELIETGAAVPLEVFVNADRVDSGLDALAGDIAILVSLLLQYGAAASEIGHALRRNPNNSRASLVGALVDRVAEFSFASAPSRLCQEATPGQARLLADGPLMLPSPAAPAASRGAGQYCPIDGRACDCDAACTGAAS